MNDPTAPGAGPLQDRADWLDGLPQARKLGAEPMHVAALAQEVMLHVDHHKGGLFRPQRAVQGKVVRFSETIPDINLRLQSVL